MPLYFLSLVLTLLILPFFSDEVTLPSRPWMYWTFLSNYETSDCLYALKFLWSISVEEQFYLLFLIFSFTFKRRIGLFVSVLILSYGIFMIYAVRYDWPTYFHTLSHLPEFAMGILTAVLFHRGIRHSIIEWGLSLLSLGALILFEFHPLIKNLVLALFFASLILVYTRIALRWGTTWYAVLTERLGTYTYGLYVYSGFVLSFSDLFLAGKNPLLQTSIELALVIAIAIVSYHIFERSFLKLKKHYR